MIVRTKFNDLMIGQNFALILLRRNQKKLPYIKISYNSYCWETKNFYFSIDPNDLVFAKPFDIIYI